MDPLNADVMFSLSITQYFAMSANGGNIEASVAGEML